MEYECSLEVVQRQKILMWWEERIQKWGIGAYFSGTSKIYHLLEALNIGWTFLWKFWFLFFNKNKQNLRLKNFGSILTNISLFSIFRTSHDNGSLHILVTSFLVSWLSRTTKIIFYVCLLTHFARQDRQNGNLRNKQNQATKWSIHCID